MAKKETESQKPVVTSLPLPASDSVLVIDLPDGQKLLVGKMPNGSVIEVATWRGTGRPDSRTNRLMLGVSSSEDQSLENDDSNSSGEVTRSLSFGYLVYLLKNIYVLAHNFVAKLVAKIRSARADRPKKNPVSTAEAAENNVEAWLEQITKKAEKAQATSTKKASSQKTARKSTSTAGKKKNPPRKTNQKGKSKSR